MTMNGGDEPMNDSEKRSIAFNNLRQHLYQVQGQLERSDRRHREYSDHALSIGRELLRTSTGWLIAYGAGMIIFIIKGGSAIDAIPGWARGIALLCAWIAVLLLFILATIYVNYWKTLYLKLEMDRVNIFEDLNITQVRISDTYLNRVPEPDNPPKANVPTPKEQPDLWRFRFARYMMYVPVVLLISGSLLAGSPLVWNLCYSGSFPDHQQLTTDGPAAAQKVDPQIECARVRCKADNGVQE